MSHLAAREQLVPVAQTRPSNMAFDLQSETCPGSVRELVVGREPAPVRIIATVVTRDTVAYRTLLDVTG